MKLILLGGAVLAGSSVVLGPRSLVLAVIFLLPSFFVAPKVGTAAVFIAATSPVFYTRSASWLELAAALRSLAPALEPRTFDFTIAALGRDLFPWSTLLPFALAGLTRPPPRPLPHADSPALARERSLRLSLLLGNVLAYGAAQVWDWSAGRWPILIFASASVGLWLWDIVRGARSPSRALFACAALAALLALDFVRFPDKRATTFAPEAGAAQRAELARSSNALPASFTAAMILPVLGPMLALLPCGALQRAHGARGATAPFGLRSAQARARDIVPFLSAALAALSLCCDYQPRLGAALAPAALHVTASP